MPLSENQPSRHFLECESVEKEAKGREEESEKGEKVEIMIGRIEFIVPVKGEEEGIRRRHRIGMEWNERRARE